MDYEIKKNKDNRYQVIKKGAKRATRVFDSKNEVEGFYCSIASNPDILNYKILYTRTI